MAIYKPAKQAQYVERDLNKKSKSKPNMYYHNIKGHIVGVQNSYSLKSYELKHFIALFKLNSKHGHFELLFYSRFENFAFVSNLVW